MKHIITAGMLAILSPWIMANSPELNMELANDPVWLVLTQYEDAQLERAITSDDFYLSEERTPAAELLATLQAISEPAADDPNTHPQCRFPARYLWLKRQGVLTGVIDQPCPEYREWHRNGTIESVSFILATGYFGNPASFYGHTLFKLNPKRSSGNSQLLDDAVNYGAIIPDGENPVSYVFKGVFGLYDAGFSQREYFYQNHSYGEGQLRDQWEYEFNFSPDEVQLIVAHTWELVGKKFDYYFFTRNCAYRMARLIEVIPSVSLVPDRDVMIPQTFFQTMGKEKLHGEPLIREIRYHPSRQSRLYHRYRELDETQKSILLEAIDKGTGFSFSDSQEYSNLPIRKQFDLVDTLMDYQQFIAASDDDQDSVTRSPEYLLALKERYRLPPGANELEIETPLPPHEGRDPAVLRQSWMSRDGEVAYGLFFRPSYYDALDAGAGHVNDSKLVMGEVALYATRDTLRIDHIDLVSIESVNRDATGLPGDRGQTWRFRFGMEQLNLACTDCLVPYFSSHIGLARPYLDQTLVLGGLIGGGLQDSRADYGYLMASGVLFANLHLGQHDIQLEADRRYYYNNHNTNMTRLKLEGRYSSELNSELRYSIRKNEATEVSIGYGVYW